MLVGDSKLSEMARARRHAPTQVVVSQLELLLHAGNQLLDVCVQNQVQILVNLDRDGLVEQLFGLQLLLVHGLRLKRHPVVMGQLEAPLAIQFDLGLPLQLVTQVLRAAVVVQDCC